MPSPWRLRSLAIALGALACCAFMAWLAYLLALQHYQRVRSAEAAQRATFYALSLEAQLSRYESLPHIAALAPELTSLLEHPDSASQRAGANAHLKAVQASAHLAVAYLIDARGNMLAASNWDEPGSAVGRNYAYRPYFTEAIQHGVGRFYGLGTTTREAGYYLAVPVRDPQRRDAPPIGVVAMKASLGSYEDALAKSGDIVLVTDRDNVVFLSSVPAWRYHALAPLSPQARQRLLAVRQYAGAPLDALQPAPTQTATAVDTVLRSGQPPSSLRVALPQQSVRRYNAQYQPTSRLGWHIAILTDPADDRQTAALAALGAAAASALAFSLAAAAWLRRARERERVRARIVDANIIGIVVWHVDGGILEANDAFLSMVGYDRDDLVSGRVRWTDLTAPEWREVHEQALREISATGRAQPNEKELVRRDGSRVSVMAGAATFEAGDKEGVAFVLDLTERKQAEEKVRESERRYHEVQSELAHANRVATMGQLAASIAHEVNQPIAATTTNAQAALRWLSAQPPDVDRARQILCDIADDGARAGDVIARIRQLIKKAPPRPEPVNVNDVIREVIELTRGEARKHCASVQTQLAGDLPSIEGDRVQLQQVVLNLVINALEAMDGVSDGARELFLSSGTADSGYVFVAVRDSGPGFVADSAERLFEAFYSTKPTGLGMGLSICRSIIAAHGGRLWASENVPRGAIFQFTMPAHPGASS